MIAHLYLTSVSVVMGPFISPIAAAAVCDELNSSGHGFNIKMWNDSEKESFMETMGILTVLPPEQELVRHYNANGVAVVPDDMPADLFGHHRMDVDFEEHFMPVCSDINEAYVHSMVLMDRLEYQKLTQK